MKDWLAIAIIPVTFYAVFFAGVNVVYVILASALLGVARYWIGRGWQKT